MYLGKSLKDGSSAAIIVPLLTEKRLSTTCFRGTSLACAGNFMRWNSALGLFKDSMVQEHFLADMFDVRSEHRLRKHKSYSVTVVHTTPVGWESTAPLEHYTGNDVEEFQPTYTDKWWGMRVKTDRTRLLTPHTNEITIVYAFKIDDRDKAIAVVYSIYPGSDIGELKGDVTEREKRVFFDWDHPGEPINSPINQKARVG